MAVMLTKQDLYLYILITLLWIGFAIFILFMGKLYYSGPDQSYKVADVLWDIKSSYFSSVILALVISMYNRGYKYHERVKNQHYLYITTMWDFESIIDEAIGDGKGGCSAFYNDLCYNKAIEYISTKYKCGHIKLTMQMYVNLQRVLVHLNNLEKQVGEGNITFGGYYGVDAQDTFFHIKEATNLVNKCMLQQCIDMSDFRQLVYELKSIIDNIRTPWRRDWRIKRKILLTLDKYPENEISEHFYFNLYLNGCNLEYVEHQRGPFKVTPKKIEPVG